MENIFAKLLANDFDLKFQWLETLPLSSNIIFTKQLLIVYLTKLMHFFKCSIRQKYGRS